MICSQKKQQKLLNNINIQKEKYFHKKVKQTQSLDQQSVSTSNNSSPQLGESSSPQHEQMSQSKSMLPSKNKFIKKTSPKKYIIKNKIVSEGHRGAGIHLVENTLACFQRGIDIGLNSVELDVWITTDKQIIVVHGKDDDTIQLDNGIDKKINEMSYDEITQNYTLKQNEKCPLLRDVLRISKNKVHVNIEIKGREEYMCDYILDLVIDYDMLNQVHFSSFLHYHQPLLIQALTKKNLPINTIQFGYLVWEHKDFDNFEQFQFNNNILAFPSNFVYDEYTLPFLFKANQRGMKLSTYFDFDVIENYHIYYRLYQIGVDCIITNQPHLLISFLQKYSKQTKKSC